MNNEYVPPLSKYVQAPAPVPKLAYSIDEVIAATGIGRTSIYEDIAAKRLVARKRGRSTIILADDLTDYLKSLEVMQ